MNQQKGFIALISTIIISFVLIAVTFTANLAGFFSRFNMLDAESKEQSSQLAQACIQAALLEANQGMYSQQENVFVGPDTHDTCTIVWIKKDWPTEGQTSMKTQSVISHAYTNLMATTDENFIITSWTECPNFTNSETSC